MGKGRIRNAGLEMRDGIWLKGRRGALARLEFRSMWRTGYVFIGEAMKSLGFGWEAAFQGMYWA